MLLHLLPPALVFICASCLLPPASCSCHHSKTELFGEVFCDFVFSEQTLCSGQRVSVQCAVCSWQCVVCSV